MTLDDKRAYMSALITTYFDGCNEADFDKMTACFVPEAVHYFPPGMYEGPFRGAETIARKWVEFVSELGSAWSIDRMICDPGSDQAVIEWTHYKTRPGTMLRGDEWYLFDPSTGLIAEIRAYYASPADRSVPVLELGGFDYAGRGYPLDCPVPR